MVSGGAGEFEHGPVRVEPDPPIGVMLYQMGETTEGSGISGVGFTAAFVMPVFERFPVIQVAAPHGLPAGRELTHSHYCGDLVAEFLGGSVGEGPGGGDPTGVRVGDQRVDGAGGRGDAAGQPGGDGAEPGE